MPEHHYILVGGGLQSALLVLALRAHQPGARIALVEAEDHLGGNHTWCFHQEDLSRRAQDWIQALVVNRWDGYEVSFPSFERELPRRYSAITASRLHEVIGNELADGRGTLLLGSRAETVAANHVRLQDGRELQGHLVVDARGPGRGVPGEQGYQKFLGWELLLDRPHGLDRPLLMDARVDQSQGFRFFYLLPFDEHRILVEDTRFSESSELDAEAFRGEIERYVADRGWAISERIREEVGILPMPWAGDTLLPEHGPLPAGYAGGWFHPGTGYSLPIAARLAEAVASLSPDDVFSGGLRALHAEQQRQREYCHLLNRMLFQWYPPEMRWHIFARFYRLSAKLISRFYSLRLTTPDRARLLVGKPPRGLSLRYRLGTGAAS